MGSSIVVKSNQDGNSFKNRSAGRGYNREYRGNRQNRRGGYGPRFNNRGNNFNQNFQQQQPLKMEQYPCRYTLICCILSRPLIRLRLIMLINFIPNI